MAKPPFKVKAIYDYTSEHDDDLNFPISQIITVTSEEGDDWYEGEYIDALGTKQEGIFPRNFVEAYEPEIPSRPVRAPRPKKEPEPAPVEPEPPIPHPATHNDEPEEDPEPEPPKPKAQPAPAPPPVAKVSSPPLPAKSPVAEVPNDPSPPSKPAPPPVAEKPAGGSFRDRIAAFNKSSAPPIAPFKPSNLGSSTFIKKPFVAPPPSRNAYVPPPREPPPTKVYRREEDPSVIAQEADQEEAERILSPTEGEDQPKPTSLKERIALLQQQQLEQAQRHAEAAEKKERKKPPSKSRTGAHDQERKDSAQDYEEVGSPEGDIAAPPPPKPRRERPTEPLQSDGNEADQSAAGETEDAEEVSTDPEKEDVKSPPLAALRSPRPEVKGNEDDEEEEEEEEEGQSEDEDIDPEVKRRMELRERMAKVSGGMGMYGMFGPPGGMPIPGAAPRQKRPEPRTKESSAEKESESNIANAPPVPVMALPGMASGPKPPGAPPRPPPPQEDSADESEDDRGDAKTPTSPRAPELREPPPPVPNVSRPPTTRGVPPVPTERAAPPPPPIESRPPPPPPPGATFSPSEGSESDDELSSHAKGGDSIHSAQSRETTPVQVQRRNTNDTIGVASPTSPNLRSARGVPPIPGQIPDAPPSSRPPPLPPTSPPSARDGSAAIKAKQAARGNSEDEVTEYEGDYDTDIGNAESHKDALTAHVRDPSLDDDDSLRKEQAQPPKLPPAGAPRNLPPPPPPPSQPPQRPSIDTPRSIPPIPQSPRAVDEDDEYDPYRYSAQPASGPTSPGASLQRRPTIEEDLYASAPARPAQPPPPPSQDRAPPPPPPQERAPPPIPPSEEPAQKLKQPSRTSGDEPRFGRRSTDQSRQGSDHAFIAGDIDLGENATGPKWWSQPTMLPPSLHGRKDIFYEFEEQISSKRDGSKSITKDLYVVFPDYSKTIISAKFDAQTSEKASLEQRHEPPPSQPRQDQLEQAYEAYGSKLAEIAVSKQNSVVGDGEPQSLVLELLKPLQGSLAPVGTRAYGVPVYTNLANASVQQIDEIRSGDIISLRNAKFQGHRGAVHSKYSMDVGKPDHVGVVVDWDGTKKKIRAWEQGRENKKVKMESFKMGDLRSGEVKVWRVMPRSWIGWEA